MVDEVAKANVMVVCGVAVRDDKVLLIRSRRHGVATPGGKVKPGESPEEALRREMLEETGMSVTRVVSLLGSETANGFEVRTYHVRVVGDLAAGDDATEAWWGDPAEVRDSPIPRDYPWILRAMEDERKVKARRDAWDAYREEMWNFATYSELEAAIVGRNVRLQKSLDDCAAAIHALAEQHGGLTNVMERSTRKIRGEFGGAPWSAELMRERDDARGVTATAVEPSAAKDGDAP